MKTIKAWAIVVEETLCQHEDTLSMYPTKKQALKGMIEPTDGLPKCTNDRVVPCTITY